VNHGITEPLVRVGDGHGSVVEEKPRLFPKRFVITTAAHCLPHDAVEPDAFLDPVSPTFSDPLGKLDGNARSGRGACSSIRRAILQCSARRITKSLVNKPRPTRN
jgi:hypothetical protein